MDVVLVGLPGSGKSVVGKRLAAKHGAEFIDLDERIEHRDGRPIPTIFAEDGEGAFRALERHAVADLGPADPEPAVRRVVATGGGAVVDPRNRWSLYRGRMSVWLDSRPEVLAQRLRRSSTSGRWSRAATRSARSATLARSASGSTPRPTSRIAGRGRGRGRSSTPSRLAAGRGSAPGRTRPRWSARRRRSGGS